MTRSRLILLAVWLIACAHPPAVEPTTTLTASGGLVTITGRLGSGSPFQIVGAETRVRIDGQLYSTAGALCASSGLVVLSCDLGNGLSLSLQSIPEAGGLLLTARVTGAPGASSAAHTIDGFEILATHSASAQLVPSGNPPILQYLHNGYQSWSFAGALQVPDGATLPRQGDVITYAAPDGSVASNEIIGLSSHSTVIDGGDGTAMVLGFVTANMWQGAIGLEATGTNRKVTAFSGFTGDSVSTADAVSSVEIDSETLFVKYEPSAEAAMVDYGAELQQRQGTRSVATLPQNGWFSWNHFFDTIDQPTVLTQASSLQALAGKSGFDLVEVDDGWENAWGDWTPNTKFGSIETLAATLHAQGQRLGIWVAPWVVETTNPIIAAHPDWWVKTEAGAPFVYSPALTSHNLQIVDLSNPDALAWAVGNLTQLEAAGVDFFKLDYLYTGAFDGQRQGMNATGVSALAEGLAAVFAGLQHASVNLCGVPWLHGALAPPSTMRISTDVAYEETATGFVAEATSARNLLARSFGPLALRADPDQYVLAPLTAAEAQTAVTVQAFAGETFSLGDDLTSLTASETSAITTAISERIAADSAGIGFAARGVFDAAGTELIPTPVIELLSNPDQSASVLPSVIVRGHFLSATNWGPSTATIDLHLLSGEQVTAIQGPAAAGGHVTLGSHATALYHLGG